MPARSRFRFPREKRILTAAGFAAVKRSGKRLTARRLIVYVAESSRPEARLGIIASRKVGNAVRRNRCKRLLREVFRLHGDSIRHPVDLVVIVKQKTGRPEFKDYERDLLRILETYFQHR